MKHCNGCSHPTICNTMGCAAEEHRANKAKAAEPSYAEIKAQRDELLKNAGRYQHLRSGYIYDFRHLCGTGLDKAIDAAIAKAEGKEGGAA